MTGLFPSSAGFDPFGAAPAETVRERVNQRADRLVELGLDPADAQVAAWLEHDRSGA